MGRIASGDVVKVKPKNDIFTVLAFIGLAIVILGLVALFMTAQAREITLM